MHTGVSIHTGILDRLHQRDLPHLLCKYVFISGGGWRLEAIVLPGVSV